MIDFRPVILAGGSGTRFWPRSRRAAAKQVLSLDGERTMIQQTLERLTSLTTPEKAWVITNNLLSSTVCCQLEDVPEEQILCEPAARNTAPAAGLAALLLERIAPDSILGVFPSDHTIGDQKVFIETIERAIAIAAAGENMVVLGIEPTRAETGYGYIEAGEPTSDGVRRVRRFSEKPNQSRAKQFLAAGNYYWNSGMFVWSARTMAKAVREHLPEMTPLLEKIVAAWGTPAFKQVFAEIYPCCENISVDYAILEPRSAKGEQKSNLYCLPASFGWNDLGSWSALYDFKAEHGEIDEQKNVLDTLSSVVLDAQGNYVYSPRKTVALIGVEGLVVVETEDALLITTREQAQEVGKVVQQLLRDGRTHLV